MSTTVRLLKAYGSNNAGEVAGFPDAIAEVLIADGWAETLPTKRRGPGRPFGSRNKNKMEGLEEVAAGPLLDANPRLGRRTK